MPIQATLYAQTTRVSANPAELQKRVISLYRQYIRSAPTFGELYEVDQPVSTIRTTIRQEFERHRYVNDNASANVLLAKGHMEYQETVNFWKQQSHVLKYFEADERTVKKPKAQDFVSQFIRGTV